ncbi:MAG: pyrE [Clostridia bacterium]|jgi:orotate phosphoribosyltransferase|nr:pyrE [Clostridia bacterium]
MEQYKKEFIEFMVRCGVVAFGDFVTKSGRKTPFFINTGNFKTGAQLGRLGEFYAKAVYEHFGSGFEVLFGPAYKGIPLSVAAAIALNNLYGIDVAYCSNRKEIKDHGDKGILMGGKPKDGDRIVIIEDVTTAGTSIHETMPILKAQGEVSVAGLIISVDRMEKGTGDRSAFWELQQQYGLNTHAIVTMEEVVEYLHNRELDGRIVIDDEMRQKIEEYYKIYGARD